MVLLLNFGGNWIHKMMFHKDMFHQVMFYKDGSHRVCKKYFVVIFQSHMKYTKYKCVDVLGN